MLAFLPNQLRRSTRSLHGSATTSSRKSEKFRVNPFAKVLLCTVFLLAAIVVLPFAIFASGVDPTTVYARAWAVLAAEPYVEQGFQVREAYWPGDLASGKRKAIRQQLFKGNEYWFWLGTEVDHAKVDRKSTRLNSSHSQISYAVFCLKKKINTCHLLPFVYKAHDV